MNVLKLDPAVQATLDDVHDRWPEMEPSDDFDPVSIALDILAGRSPRGKGQKDLEKQTQRLEKDVNKIVNDYHLGFNNSIQTFSGIVTDVTDAQKRVNQLKRDLLEARHFEQLLRTRREGLSRLWTKTIEYKEMNRLLTQIEELKRMPTRIGEYIASQQYLHAVEHLNQAIKIINSYGINEIGAMADIRRTLEEHQEKLPSKLSEELLTQLFLRSSTSSSSSSTAASKQQVLASEELSDDEDLDAVTAQATSGGQAHRRDIASMSSDSLAHSHSSSTVLSPLSDQSAWARSKRQSITALGSTGSLAASAASVPGATSSAPSTATLATGGAGGGRRGSRRASGIAGGDEHAPSINASWFSARKKLGPKDDVTEDMDKVITDDPLRHLAILIDCLGKLNHLPIIAQVIQRTLKTELFQLAESTINDVEALESSGLKTSSAVTSRFNASAIAASNKNNPISRARILRTLLTELYRKYRVVYKRLRFAYERINYRVGSSSVLVVDVMWESIQEELESVLRDYLQDPMTAKNAGHPKPVATTTIKLKTRMFSFSNTASSKMMATHYRELMRQEEGNGDGSSSSSSAGQQDMMDDIYLGMAAGTGGHRMLLSPDVLNIAHLYRPTERFTSRMMKMIHKDASSTDAIADCRLQAFINDFVLEEVLPLIREKVLYQMSSSIKYGQGSAPTKTELFIDGGSERPLLKSAVVVLWLIRELCKILTAVPLHYTEYISLVQILLVEYLNTCERQFNYVVEGSGGASALQGGGAESSATEIAASKWSQNPAIRKHMARHPLLSLTSSTAPAATATTGAGASTMMRMDDLVNEDQTKAELEAKGDRMIERDELIWDPARLLLIATLHQSLTWMTEQLEGMRAAAMDENATIILATSEDVSHTLIDLDTIGGSHRSSHSSGHHRSAANATEVNNAIGAAMFMYMDDDSKSRFEEIMERIKEMSHNCLFLLRTEIRCHAHFYIDLAIREGSYAPLSEAVEPDPYVVSLNKDLSSIEEALGRRLRDSALLFVFDGVPQLLGSLLGANAKYVGQINQFGVLRIARNVFALQKCLSPAVAPGIILDRHLDRARQLYSILEYDAENLANFIASHLTVFSPSELDIILNLLLRNAQLLGHDSLGFNHAVEQQINEVKKRAAIWTRT